LPHRAGQPIPALDSHRAAADAGLAPSATSPSSSLSAAVVSLAETALQACAIGWVSTPSACPAGTDPDTAPSNHSPRAVFDDRVIADGMTLLTELALRRLAAGGQAGQ
jgi:hypothetical protein